MMRYSAADAVPLPMEDSAIWR